MDGHRAHSGVPAVAVALSKTRKSKAGVFFLGAAFRCLRVAALSIFPQCLLARPFGPWYSAELDRADRRASSSTECGVTVHGNSGRSATSFRSALGSTCGPRVARRRAACSTRTRPSRTWSPRSPHHASLLSKARHVLFDSNVEHEVLLPSSGISRRCKMISGFLLARGLVSTKAIEDWT